MKKIPFIQTDVFTDERYDFSGNQLATFWNKSLNKTINQDEMQSIAREMNFSETTFIVDSLLKNCDAKVEIFTPKMKLNFAGHPTLGTAFVMKDTGLIEKNINKITLELGIGPIEVTYNNDQTISMYQPKPKFREKFEDRKAIAEILELAESDIDENIPMQVVETGFPFLIIPLKSLKAIQKISLNQQLQWKYLKDFITTDLLVLTRETLHKDSSVHVRMFAPFSGVLEDPATGGAAGPIGAYLEYWNVLKNHKKSDVINIEQGFEVNRPSLLFSKVLYEKDQISKVIVSGKVRKRTISEFLL